jgi:hypothetical protein
MGIYHGWVRGFPRGAHSPHWAGAKLSSAAEEGGDGAELRQERAHAFPRVLPDRARAYVFVRNAYGPPERSRVQKRAEAVLTVEGTGPAPAGACARTFSCARIPPVHVRTGVGHARAQTGSSVAGQSC